MAKLSYLNLVNRVMRRMTKADISDVTALTGQAQITADAINEAQNALFAESINWYSLYNTRTFATVADAAEVALASDFGRCIDLIDTTNNLLLIEGYNREFDRADPDADDTGNPTHFIVQGDNYRFFRIPAGAYTIRDRYWKIPTTLAANSDTSDLPIECENCLIQWAWAEVLRYVNSFDKADRVETKFRKMLSLAKVANDKRLDKMKVLKPFGITNDYGGPRFPSSYGRVY